MPLVRAVPYLGPGVVLAVVDPGVGTGRRAWPSPRWRRRGAGRPARFVRRSRQRAARARPRPTAASDGRRYRPGGPVPADHRRGRRPGIGATFDGRDLFAPAAAHLVLGGVAGTLGPELDPVSLVAVDPGPPGRRDGAGTPPRRTDGPAT